MNTIFAGGKSIKNLGHRQFALALFLLRYSGWHGIDKRAHSVARSLERRGCVETVTHDNGTMQARWNQQST